jgi:hypothetical protein
MKAFTLPQRVKLLVLTVIFITPQSNAVVDGIGLLPGVNFSIPSATENPTFPGKPAITFTVGAFLDIYFEENWAFSPEIRYAGKGAQIQMFNLLPGNIQLDSLDFHFAFKYIVFPHFSITGGPYVSFLVKRNLQLLSFANSDLSSRFAAFDTGFTLGVEYRIPIEESFDLVAALRFQHGLFDINNDATDSYKTRDLTVLLGAKYIF